MKEAFSRILRLKERDEFRDKVLKERLHTILPAIMNEHEIDMWITIGREYNEDPVIHTFFPSAVDSSRRLTIFMFCKDDEGSVQRFVLNSNPALEPFYQNVWEDKTETQWQCAARLIHKRAPKKIAVNAGSLHSVSDGLTVNAFNELLRAAKMGKERFVSSESLLVDWLQTRSSLELAAYPHICELAREIAEEALSNRVIHPGVTSTKDAVEWIRQKVLDLGLQTSFYPTVDIQRQGSGTDRLENTIIKPGDIVHLDFGIHYLGLATDTQQLAYVLKNGEETVPNSLTEALEEALRFEDIVSTSISEGRSGNQVFTDSMRVSREKNINAMLYSHPLGVHCHGAGPLIGLYDKQEEIPGRGDLLIKNNTCYALEFNIRKYISEWNQEVPIYLEEPISFIDGRVVYLAKRQKEFHLIR
ncbi:M24 family metallopeptidase [Rossellomorea aquimaris]|uniref:Aminopeptidase P family protein n=1 Tax=Rossellomorea aquimaris TaxID=189382 RepID=A0A5D4U6G7_9BACI|nr:M24 family metallopeptidase [Rossellomorea aquimaris]TYS82832.1 aminopeptidase P family protein [Rossellomorea aquimaris]